MSEYRICIYARESRDDNGLNIESALTQRDMLIDFVYANKLGEVKTIYVDDNISGSDFNRKSLEYIKDDVLNKKIDMLLIKDLSRLGRNNARTLLLLDFFEENNVRVVTYDGRYDSLKDNETIGIDTWYNERYIRDISRKTRASLKYRIERGDYIGTAPYGYIKAGSNNRLVVDALKSLVVKKIFNLYSEGYGYKSIASILQHDGHKPPQSDQQKWSPATIKRILTSTVYIGDTVQGVSEKISYKTKKTRRLPPEKWVCTEGTHEPIISDELFEKVQQIRQSRINTAAVHTADPSLFKGILYCGECGSKMYARKDKNGNVIYKCSNYLKNGKSNCSGKGYPENMILSAARRGLDEILKDKTAREKLNSRIRAFNQAAAVRREAAQSLISTELASLKHKIQSAYNDKLENKIDEKLFFDTYETLSARIKDLESKQTESPPGQSGNAEKMAAGAASRLTGLSNGFLRQVIRKITYSSDNAVKIEIHD